MNKYVVLIIIAAVLIAAGIGYRVFIIPQSSVPVTTGNVREITVTSQKDKWNFNPHFIEVDRGDTIKIEFVVTQEGDFPYYCSVPCGDGIVDGKKRGHFDMTGKIHVRSAANPAK